MSPTTFSDEGGGRGPEEIRTPLCRSLPATVTNASALRRELRAWLDVDVDPETAEDLVLAGYEALANVVEHAYRGGQGPLLLTARRTRDAVLVEVTDHGTWRDGPSGPLRGRGIPLMHQLSDHAQLETSSSGTRVRLHVGASARAAARRPVSPPGLSSGPGTRSARARDPSPRSDAGSPGNPRRRAS